MDQWERLLLSAQRDNHPYPVYVNVKTFPVRVSLKLNYYPFIFTLSLYNWGLFFTFLYQSYSNLVSDIERFLGPYCENYIKIGQEIKLFPIDPHCKIFTLQPLFNDVMASLNSGYRVKLLQWGLWGKVLFLYRFLWNFHSRSLKNVQYHWQSLSEIDKEMWTKTLNYIMTKWR